MKYDPIREERKWHEGGERGRRKSKPLPARHHFAHSCVRSKLYDTLVGLGCDNTSSILDVGCGSGTGATIYVQKASKNIVGVDVSYGALKSFRASGFQAILADVNKLPLHSGSFDYVLCSDLLHHLVGQRDLMEYVMEFVRVTKRGGVCSCVRAECISPLWDFNEHF